MKLKFNYFLLGSLFSLLLIGCQPPEPVVFGMPQSQWNTLTRDQQNQVIQGYNEQQRINAQNAPIENAISAAQTILGNKTSNNSCCNDQTIDLFHHHHHHHHAAPTPAAPPPAPSVTPAQPVTPVSPIKPLTPPVTPAQPVTPPIQPLTPTSSN